MIIVSQYLGSTTMWTRRESAFRNDCGFLRASDIVSFRQLPDDFFSVVVPGLLYECPDGD